MVTPATKYHEAFELDGAKKENTADDAGALPATPKTAINSSARGGHRSWFTSTGHFANMFGKHNSGGFGIQGRHMTQMLR